MPTSPPELTHLSLDAVAAGCRGEAQRSRNQELGSCFELFRRALERADQAAWNAVMAQYQRLVLEWVHAARRSAPALGDPEELAHEAFERFWRTLAGRCNPLVARFPHVGALLKYLQQCAVTTVLDQRRRTLRQARLDTRIAGDALREAHDAGFEADTVAHVDQAALLARVRTWVAAIEALRARLPRDTLHLAFLHDKLPIYHAAARLNMEQHDPIGGLHALSLALSAPIPQPPDDGPPDLAEQLRTLREQWHWQQSRMDDLAERGARSNTAHHAAASTAPPGRPTNCSCR
jgi:DNA-directed RNA polymerase specialized sigma24 family protein